MSSGGEMFPDFLSFVTRGVKESKGSSPLKADGETIYFWSNRKDLLENVERL